MNIANDSAEEFEEEPTTLYEPPPKLEKYAKLSRKFCPVPINLPKRIFEPLDDRPEFRSFILSQPDNIDVALGTEKMCKYFDSLTGYDQNELRKEMIISGRLMPAYFANRAPPGSLNRFLQQNNLFNQRNLDQNNSQQGSAIAIPSHQYHNATPPPRQYHNVAATPSNQDRSFSTHSRPRTSFPESQFPLRFEGLQRLPDLFAVINYSTELRKNEVITVETIEATCLR